MKAKAGNLQSWQLLTEKWWFKSNSLRDWETVLGRSTQFQDRILRNEMRQCWISTRPSLEPSPAIGLCWSPARRQTLAKPSNHQRYMLHCRVSLRATNELAVHVLYTPNFKHLENNQKQQCCDNVATALICNNAQKTSMAVAKGETVIKLNSWKYKKSLFCKTQ